VVPWRGRHTPGARVRGNVGVTMQARILDHDAVRATSNPDEIAAAVTAGTPIWIDLEKQSPEADRFLADVAKLHPLTIEDIWAPVSSPKIDDFPNYLYVIVHGIGTTKRHRIDLVELDVVIGPTYVITHDPNNLVTGDLKSECDRSSRLLAKGVAWFAHAALDHAVDRYMPVVDELDTEIENLETDVLDKAGTPGGRTVLTRILAFKRMLQALRRTSIHQREILLRLSRGEFDEIPADALPFYRDIYDHFIRINDITDGYRDLVTSSLDAYLSVQSNRMNEIMKTLTLISTVMLPLTFIAGVYGMNFKNIPEYDLSFGYPMALGLMALVATCIAWWFRRKGWIGKKARG
jgi:magnesium transporter